MDEERARKEIEHERERWVAAINDGDADTFVAVLTDDVVWLPFRGPALSTRGRILDWLREPFQQFDYRYSVGNVRLRIAGEWAVERADFETRATDRQGRPAPVHRGTYTLIWRHSHAGWRIERYVDHTGWDEGDARDADAGIDNAGSP